MTRDLHPLIVGSGGAARALRMAMAFYPEALATPRLHRRGEPLPEADPERSLLVLANPHALHAPLLLEAAERGYRWALCEKPAAVDFGQIGTLESVADRGLECWICHGYRMLWGPQTLRSAWAEGRFGEVLSIEGRYWQAGAVRGPARPGWKDDPALGGPHDVLLDLGSHWTDLVIYLSGLAPRHTQARRWYVNAASPHRDSQVHITIEHTSPRDGSMVSFGSVSKTVHGAGNQLEVHILGEAATASWSFADPDIIVWGRGRERTTEARTAADPPARLAPFHGMGWLEGYASLVGDLVGHVVYGRPRRGPTLDEQIVVLRALLGAVDTVDT
ncbi:MAG: Gfo/Idh/MocA family oxidoreductase [Acidobacteriota bacterium]